MAVATHLRKQRGDKNRKEGHKCHHHGCHGVQHAVCTEELEGAAQRHRSKEKGEGPGGCSSDTGCMRSHCDVLPCRQQLGSWCLGSALTCSSCSSLHLCPGF
jgi:hypothetical protein